MQNVIMPSYKSELHLNAVVAIIIYPVFLNVFFLAFSYTTYLLLSRFYNFIKSILIYLYYVSIILVRGALLLYLPIGEIQKLTNITMIILKTNLNKRLASPNIQWQSENGIINPAVHTERSRKI